MALIGMTEAGNRTGMTRPGIRNALKKAGVPLVAIAANAYAVEETELVAFMQQREGYAGRGRPRGSKNKDGVETTE